VKFGNGVVICEDLRMDTVRCNVLANSAKL